MKFLVFLSIAGLSSLELILATGASVSGAAARRGQRRAVQLEARDAQTDCDETAPACGSAFQIATQCPPGTESITGMGCIGLECMAHSQDGQGCCTDPWAVACSDPSTSIECTLGHTLVGTTCLAGAYCSSTNTVLSDDGVGCCMDANAASCSNMITPTSCAENYELEGSGIYRCVFNEGSSLGSQNLLET